MAGNGVVLEGEDGEIFAVARTFHPAVGHFVDEHEVGIDPGTSVAEGGCDFHALGKIRGPDGGGESVFRIVGPADRFVGSFEFGDGDDGAKDFLLDNLVLLVGSGQNRGFEEESFSCNRGASGYFLDVLGLGGTGDIAENPFAVGGGDEWAEFIVRVFGLVVLERGHGFTEFADEVIVNLGAGIDSASGGTILACIVEAELADGGDEFGEIGIVENKHGGFPAQFEVGSFNIGGGGGENMGTGSDASRERNHSDEGMGDEGLARGGTSPRDDVGYASRQVFREDTAEVKGGERGDFRGFEDNGISRREGRSEFPNGHHQGVVPWDNGTDDADRVAPKHGGITCHVFSSRRSGGAAGGTRKESKAVAGGRNFIGEKEVTRFATVRAFEVGIVFCVGVDAIGNLEEKIGAFSGGGATP